MAGNLGTHSGVHLINIDDLTWQEGSTMTTMMLLTIRLMSIYHNRHTSTISALINIYGDYQAGIIIGLMSIYHDYQISITITSICSYHDYSPADTTHKLVSLCLHARW